jgi:hypothetical protein
MIVSAVGFLRVVCSESLCFDQSQEETRRLALGFYDHFVQSPFDVNLMDAGIWSRGSRCFACYWLALFASREFNFLCDCLCTWTDQALWNQWWSSALGNSGTSARCLPLQSFSFEWIRFSLVFLWLNRTLFDDAVAYSLRKTREFLVCMFMIGESEVKKKG